jgi:hypothetical protein
VLLYELKPLEIETWWIVKHVDIDKKEEFRGFNE